MNSRKSIIILLVAVVVLLLAGCGGTPSEPATTPTPTLPTVSPTYTLIPVSPTPTIIPTQTPGPPGSRPQAGLWQGSSGAFFEVSPDGNIINFKISIPIGADRCTISIDEEIVVGSDGTFLLGGLREDGTLSGNSISGKFDSTTTMTGTYSDAWLCGNMISTSSAEGTWDAKLQEP